MKIFLQSVLFTILPFIGFSQIVETYDTIIGTTTYDLQSNGACQNRIYLYDDGTIGVTYTFSNEMFSGYYDRGTGYNYFDGANWNIWDTARLENDRTGWPSYAPLGESGEIIFSHYSGADMDGLSYLFRTEKGTGEWQQTDYFGPSGHEGLLWPRMVTGGMDHNRVYLISLTRPIANGGNPYMGLDGALVYSLSTDGAQTWEIQNEILPGMDSSEYTHFTGDCYAWAEPKNNVVAFATGSYDHDLFLMKSTDEGLTFEKTVIWDHPYDPELDTIPTNFFYCPDGSMHAAIDNSGKVHVVFSIASTGWGGTEWTRPDTVDGIVYWNETMETFAESPNSLNPNNHPESQLVKDYNLIGYRQDINGNGQFDILGESGLYPMRGISTMPQIVIDEMNRIFLLFCTITETYDNGLQDYRRIWMRSSLNGGLSWRPFYHFAGDDNTTIFNEYFYPSLAAGSDDYIYFYYHQDYEPGLDIYNGGGKDYLHWVHFAKVAKDAVVGIEDFSAKKESLIVSQNTPNPFSDKTTIAVHLPQPLTLQFKIFNPAGQLVYQSKLNGNKGRNTINISGKDFQPGIYFYTISTADYSCTKKMIIH